ncbi:MAG: hypothetical protein ABJC13_11775 [Acidobacteriota bacterium]
MLTHLLPDSVRTLYAELLDLATDLIGCVSGGPPDLSEQTGKKFRQILGRPVPDPH